MLLHPNHNNKKCLDVRGNIQADGTPVQMYAREASDFLCSKTKFIFYSYDCNGTGAQNWIVNRERTEVQLAGTRFCLDAGPVAGEFVIALNHDQTS